jgi:hypothetical protein
MNVIPGSVSVIVCCIWNKLLVLEWIAALKWTCRILFVGFY